ncbi:hypothetical protein PG985_014280 [Apiospora marii]|uniref:uncharacterized protein n=1 Tax=Apiospora marii TaxID=335849 RepID=UPI0031309ECF
MATILYAQESDRPAAAKKPMYQYQATGNGDSIHENLKLGIKLKPHVKRLFFEMLHVDYGSSSMGASPVQQQHPSVYGDLLRFARSLISYASDFGQAWDEENLTAGTQPEAVTYICAACADFDPSDFAMMLYYFYSHHRLLDGGDKIEYTGVMQALLDDLTRSGNNERLHRKLSIDYNVLVPQVCKGGPQRSCNTHHNYGLYTMARSVFECPE